MLRRPLCWLGLVGLGIGALAASPARALPFELEFTIVITGFSDAPITDVSALSLGDVGTAVAGFDTADLAVTGQTASSISLRDSPAQSGYLSHVFFGVGYDGSSGGDEEFVLTLGDGQPGLGSDTISIFTDNGDGTGNWLSAVDPTGTAFDASAFAMLDALFLGLDTALFTQGGWGVTDEPDDAVHGNVIPEPGTGWLLATGLVVLARRRPSPRRA